ncbi:DNA cytosine methyltransferase [Streptomyces sp. BI20]|uniref:DNA cytosine methyltransferase n=1 Tax=Streptomyces sp. BI20 TaxID=3403460 RepID=UPI003C76D37D
MTAAPPSPTTTQAPAAPAGPAAPAPAPPRGLVDLFAGPGGLDVAAHWLGLAVTGVEIDPNACATRAAAGLATHAGDVQLVWPMDFPEAEVLAGGPPCQTYTVAGAGAGRRALDLVLSFVDRLAAAEGDTARKEIQEDLHLLEDPRTGLVLRPLWWALSAHEAGTPYRAIVLEQVPAVLPVWEAMGRVLRDRLGYSVAHGILHTEEFGVPQTRRRAILVARLDGEAALPEPTHARFHKNARSVRPATVPAGRRPCVTMGAALGRTDAFTVVSNYGTGGDARLRGRRTSAEPAFTVTGKVSRNRLEAPDGTELPRLTLSEAGRLQTFPHDYPWSGSDVAQQIGNAIPPRLAAHVLAAALGVRLDEARLDEVVALPWARTRDGWPLTRPLPDA